ncbi:glucan endo-1,3-beta-D-glucosidase [Salvia divinorum]|uniref:Glucan endo-1,3-beta-D-glucosidase n=1 Tax=Salvia divinorum TaxID=28513 RepID=A0ABD1H4H9_SALDI
MGPTTTVALVVVAALLCCTEGFIGMNWGRMSAQRLLPSQVVDLMLQNGIRNVRISTTQSDILRAFQGSGINLSITLFNGNQPHNMSTARAWLQSKYHLLRVNNIESVHMGGGVYPFNWGGIFVPDYDVNWRGLNYVQAALNETGFGGKIKANIVHYSGELIPNITKPSDAAFLDNIKERMTEFLRFLRDNDAPFLVDFNPITDLERCGLDLSFAFPDNKSKLVINDINGAVYTNGFQWQYDCFVWALQKLNFSDIKIDVMTVGWPTDGYPGATSLNAERYFKYLLPMVISNQGTPKRPGVPINTFINSLADEPKMRTDVISPFNRHWGIYRSNGQPKFKIDLSGQGRDIYPTTMKGIMRMPQRWCVFSGNSTDTDKVRRQVERACAKGDCTTLAPAASCSNLGFGKNASYAFNVYFQTYFQDEKSCDFEGLSYITDQDPSTEDCLFPVEVVRGNQLIEFSAALALLWPLNIRGVVLLIVLYILGGFL